MIRTKKPEIPEEILQLARFLLEAGIKHKIRLATEEADDRTLWYACRLEAGDREGLLRPITSMQDLISFFKHHA